MDNHQATTPRNSTTKTADAHAKLRFKPFHEGRISPRVEMELTAGSSRTRAPSPASSTPSTRF
jgi:hypothetical protein